MKASDVKEYAVSVGLSVLQPEKLRSESFLSELKKIQAELFVVVAFRMLPEVVWSIPPKGTINLHGSLLPDYRGAAPINWAIMNGESRSGVTTFFISHQIDTGDIIDFKSCNITEGMIAGELHDLLMSMGAELLLDTVKKIDSGQVKPVNQESLIAGKLPKHAPKLNKENTRINWNSAAASLVNFIHGLSPYPAAWTMLNDGGQVHIFRIFRARENFVNRPLAPGACVIDQNRIFCGTSNGCIELLEIQKQGKGRMSAAEFANGLRTNEFELH